MQKPTSEEYLALDQLTPRVDFACYWRSSGPVWYRYRVPSHHFLLIEQGTIRARLGNEIVTLSSGDLVCMRPGAPNEMGFDGAVSYYETHVAFADPPRHRLPLWLDGPLPQKLPAGERLAEVTAVFRTLCSQLPHSSAAAALRVRAAIHELLATMLELHRPSPPAPRKRDPWQEALYRVTSELSTPFELSAAAAELGVSVDHMTREFKRRFGSTPVALRTAARLRRAVELIEDTELAIKEVAFEVGYADAAAFTRAFRHHFAITPNDLRRSPGTARPDAAPPMTLPFPINEHIRPASESGWFMWDPVPSPSNGSCENS